ncbi:hypothetical protein BDV59DRAFT_201586 [Aspergillus ambiguus]|uniref:uncharacterized protein n=1 Tax=Aspergillus ambiguus TaxID=176160 RepID=UPI003CCCC4A8
MTSEPESPASQIFPLAHPPPKTTQCLRFTPRLVLQIQQLAPSTGRPVPVLEVLRPSRLAKCVDVGGAASRVKLSARGLYIAQSEPYLHLAANATAGRYDVVGAIPALSASAARDMLHLVSCADPCAITSTPRGYRFHLPGDDGGKILEWAKRPRSADEDKGDRFVLGIVAAEDLRRPWLATLTKRGLKVPPWDRPQREYLAADEATIYTWVLTMGVYVAAREGWINAV